MLQLLSISLNRFFDSVEVLVDYEDYNGIHGVYMLSFYKTTHIQLQMFIEYKVYPQTFHELYSLNYELCLIITHSLAF